ncbi:MAG: hypothetical protein Q8L22_16275 [Reyranella sp.]|nr:hypothetical protein [Reyranella sp.]
MNRLAIIACILGALISSIAYGQNAPAPPPGDFRAIVKPGEAVQISNHGNFANCKTTGEAELIITKPPKNGVATIRPAEATPPGCTSPITMSGVFYKPNAGFVGIDEFSYDRTTKGGIAPRTAGIRRVIVDVKP